MKKTIFLTALLGLFLASTAIADPGDMLWARTYGGGSYDWGQSVQQTSDGGYIVAGITESFGAGLRDVYLVKTDANGDTLWTRTYGGSDWDRGYSVQQTTDGGYIIAGCTQSYTAGGWDFYLVKTNFRGTRLWTRHYGGSRMDIAYSVQQTTDGGYIIAGETQSFGAGDPDIYLVKTDANGGIVWTRTYGGSETEYGRCVQQTSDGGYIVAGMTDSFGAGGKDVYLVKTDANGDSLWTRAYGGSGGDQGHSVQQTTDGGYIIAGRTGSFGAGSADFYLVKTDADGNALWTRTYGGSAYDEAFSVQQTTDGGYIIGGVTEFWGPRAYDFYLVKTNANGDTLWTRAYGENGWDHCYSVQQTTDGGYILTGITGSFGAVAYDVGLVRVAGEPEISMSCQNLTPIFCRGKNLYFKLTVRNRLGENISGTLTFSGYSGYDCNPGNELIAIPRTKSYPPGVTEEYYRFKVPNAVGPGQYSASVGGTLGGVDLFCCMNTDIIQCGPWKSGSNTEWELVEVNASDYESSLPASASLSQCYPNPFNAQTVIEYQLPVSSTVKVEVYNLLGSKVATLINGEQEAGYRSVTWDASEISSGVYFYKLTAGDYTETRRMMLVK